MLFARKTATEKRAAFRKALASGRLLQFPGAHAPIVYAAAVTRDAGAPEAARLFLDFLVSAEGQAILSRFGFLPAPAR